ncbi:formylglycine-generating enzyme family protein [Treponema sp.]|uniref:formylglycine-generating enzyme family protein n=1 Tax=Treponema sp. TaxID=166 RepID=UPI00298D6FD8|nr:SUMF1/EgtB/PvdO family nonheme iron enzyme [Treponema sp.]MCR5612936.1 SUMF1/EgtB/PvdO family nonheme iron enzyme [Treponema sp.]
MKNIKTLYSIAAILLILSVSSCKKNGAESKDNKEGNSTPAELKKEIKKEAPELFNMITVKGGWFTLGTDKQIDTFNISYDSIRPHKTYVSDFMMSSSEITQEKYEEIMDSNPSIHADKYRPVEIGRFTDAIIFCNKLSIKENLTPCYTVDGKPLLDQLDLFWTKESEEFYLFMEKLKCDFDADGYRLPTEAEWMYAARGGSNQESFKYSGSDNPLAVAVFDIYGEDANYTSPQAVKTKLPNSLGFYDMSGNIDELVWDYYAVFPECFTVNYTGPERRDPTHCKYAILKGGSYKETQHVEIRTSLNLYYDDVKFGFRICRTIKSDDSKKRTQEAIEVAKKNQLEFIKQAVYSRLVKVEPATYHNYYGKEIKIDGIYTSKLPLSQKDVFLVSDKYAGECMTRFDDNEELRRYNAILYLNKISTMLGYKPYYIIQIKDENGEYIIADEELLIEKNIDFCYSDNDYKDINENAVKNIKISTDKNADGFRFVTEDEKFCLNEMSNIFIKENQDINYNLENGLIADKYKYVEYESKNNEFKYLYNEVEYSYFMFCKNIPQDPKQISEIDKEIEKYTEKDRIKKLAKLEECFGRSVNDIMKNVKGGKALQSLDTENNEFKEVTIGSFLMAEYPMPKQLFYAITGRDYFNEDDYTGSGKHEDAWQNIELSWYDAAAVCNALSELYKLQKVYTFKENGVSIDYTANGFRMPTEAEWEHAARSGTTDKSLKYGVYIDSVIYYGNTNFFEYNKDDWESYYSPIKDAHPFNVDAGKPNSLGIYNLAGYCQEWCNDFQYFSHDDFYDKHTSYMTSAYDSMPYYSTTMPLGQIYAPDHIVKGSGFHHTDASDVKLSARESHSPYTRNSLRLVRTVNHDEMKKLIEEHNKEHLEMLAAQKGFFDQNLKMIPVKAREYRKRYDDGEERKGDEYIIKISDFEIADSEITNEMFIRVMHYNPWIKEADSNNYNSKFYNSSPNAPITNVSLKTAMYFCNELSLMYGYKPFYNIEEATINEDSDGFRLPLHTEWLFAAMEANPKYKLKYSGSDDPEKVAVFDKSKPQDIKTKDPNKLGLYDMSGNASEISHYVNEYIKYYRNIEIMGGSFRYERTIYNSEGFSFDDDARYSGIRVVRSVKHD